MSAIAYFLETEGIQTTGISLVRENTEALQPPRFLWTPFPLGRPLGLPGDAAFQHRVIAAALRLLDRAAGPVLEDYPEDIPALPPDQMPACPVSFTRPAVPLDNWRARLAAELASLRPWYALSMRRRGRTTVGISKQPLDVLVGQLAQALETPLAAHTDLRALKYGLEDLKSCYQEALTAQPGPTDPKAIADIVWQETELGRAMLALHARCAQHEDRRFNAFARGIAPRNQIAG